MNMPSPDERLLEYRVAELERSHRELARALQGMLVSVNDLVFEVKSGKRILALIGLVFGVAQPFIIYYLSH